MTQDLVNRLVSQVEKHIHGPQREQLLKKLEANPTADTLAEATYNTIVAIDAQASQRGAGVSLDVLLGVATETIDMLIEIMQAMGIQLNPDEMREETLLKIVMLHMEKVGDDPEEKAAAEAVLAQMVDDGTMGESMDHIVSKADASPDEIIAAGGGPPGPQKKPMAAGIQQGLMN